jgi:hypothetical protein
MLFYLSRLLRVCPRTVAFLTMAGLAAGRLLAANYYVSPTGSSSGTGTLSSPWDLYSTLSGSSVQPGDTVWLRGGTYYAPNSNGLISYIAGTASNPITVRNYNNEHATIDGRYTEYTLAVYGGYVWFWGLEFMDSNPARVSPNTQPVQSWGPSIYAPGIKLINCVIHDTAQGVSAYNQSPDSEFTGNIVYYNGYYGTDRPHGHGMYMQNISGLKTLANNFVGDNFDEGMQIYGSGNANVTGFRVHGNTLYNTSSFPGLRYQYNLLIAGGSTRNNIQVQNNYSYFTPAADYGFVDLGQYSAGQDMLATGNVFTGGYTAFDMEGQAGPVTFTGNTVYTRPTAVRLVSLILYGSETLSSYTWNNNAYYGLNNFFLGYNTTFAGWQAATGFDKSSTFTSNAPSGVWTYVEPNPYETKRANVTIYNWNLQTSVAVDFSTFLSPGDPYTVQDAQNFYGPVVVTGTYTGSPVSIPMTGLTKAVPVGAGTPAHTAPQFGTFVVLSSASSSSPPANVTVSPASSTLSASQTVQLNANTAVSWKIQPGLGTISSAGLYTAPASISTQQPVTVTATSVSNPNAQGTATITLQPPTVTVSLSPQSVTLQASQTQSFTATVTGSSAGVTWSLNPNIGLISAAGLYTAPASIASQQTVVVTATSVADASKSGSASVTLQPAGTGTPGLTTLRVNAGAGAYVDPQGLTWNTDFGYNGGSAYNVSTPVSGTTSPLLYQKERWNYPNLTYQFAVTPGTYDVTLKFAEIYSGVVGSRVFNIAINGSTLLSNFDIDAQAGGAFRAIDKTFTVTATGGQINITLSSVVGSPKVNAIQIVPSAGTAPVSVQVSPGSPTLQASQTQQFTATVTGTSTTGVTWSLNPNVGSISAAGLYTAPASIASQQTVVVTATSVADASKSGSASVTLQPAGTGTPGLTTLRVNAGAGAYVDPQGLTWTTDFGYNGGSAYSVSTPISGTTTPALYQKERWNYPILSYQFAVSPGTYTVTLKFAEIYSGVVGSRVFNIAINGVTLLSNFDITAQASGPFRALDKTFTVNASNGQIDISLSSVTGSPKIDAIEIVPGP